MSRLASSAAALPLLAAVAALLAVAPPQHAADAPAPKAKPRIEYNRDVRPILAENCFACHGPDSAARKADLRLDRRDDAVKAEAIKPGDPGDSEAIRRVLLAEDDEAVMPPVKSHKKLTAAQKDVLKAWVAAGAEYQAHWSFIPPVRPAPPRVKSPGWAKNPIDRFVLAELEKRGLSPAPEADRRTLARRVAFDLTGLPPEPADVEAFVNDTADNAYEKYIDKTLASPHWGEHRGRYWLDAARYADTHGIHFDNYREMWSYRDWVINAFNRNLPFNQFTVEQLAGDLLPGKTLDQQVATGFVRCNITTNEGGAIAEEYLVLYARDRTETLAQTFLGLTAGCAVCHDHKFDPITAKDFYSLSAFFNNTPQGGMDGNIPNTPPVVTVPRAEDRAGWDALQEQIAAVREEAADRKAEAKADFAAWQAASKPDAVAGRVPSDRLVFHAPLAEGAGKEVAATADGKPLAAKLTDGFAWVAGPGKAKAFGIRPGKPASFADAGNFDRTQPFSAALWFNIGRRESGTLLGRMDNSSRERGWDLMLERDRVAFHLVNAWPSDAVKLVMKTPVKAKAWHHVAVTYDGSGKASGVKFYLDGEPQPVEVANDHLTRTTLTAVPLTLGQRATNNRLASAALQDVRLYSRVLTHAETSQVALAPARPRRWPSRPPSACAWRPTTCSAGGWPRSTGRTRRSTRGCRRWPCRRPG